MTRVTLPSIAYIATQVSHQARSPFRFLKSLQVRFALSSSPVFSRADTVTDSETFYTTVLDLFYDIEEQEEVDDLLAWWNRYVTHLIHINLLSQANSSSQIFPNFPLSRPAPFHNSALAKIKQKRMERRLEMVLATSDSDSAV